MGPIGVILFAIGEGPMRTATVMLLGMPLGIALAVPRTSAHPAWLTWETLSFPILSTSNRKHENSLGFFSFSDLRCSKSIEGLTRPCVGSESNPCRIRVKNPFFSAGRGIDGPGCWAQIFMAQDVGRLLRNFGKIAPKFWTLD